MCNFVALPENKDWIDAAGALLPILLCLVALYFTHTQVKIAESKRRDELFDKRFPIYDRLVRWSGEVYIESGYTLNLHRDHEEIKHQSAFIFGKSIDSFYQEVDEHYKSLAEFKLNGTILHPDKARRDMPDYIGLIDYFRLLPSRIRNEFKPYIDIQK